MSEVNLPHLQDIFRGSQEYTAAQGRASDLESEAAAIRSSTSAVYAEQWKEAYQDFKQLAGVPVEGKPFLLNAINFCSLEVPLRMTSQKPYDKEVVVTLFDSIKPNEPIVTKDSWGIVATEPKTVIHDFLSGIGIKLEVEIEPIDSEDTARTREEVDPRSQGTAFIGRAAIEGWAESIEYRRTKKCHETCFESNIDELKRTKRIIKSFNALLDLNLPTDHIKEEIDREKADRESVQRLRSRRAEHRRRMSPLQRALTPRGI